jgi:hypothetical protein
MKHIKLFEQWDDPFGEEVYKNELTPFKTINNNIYLTDGIIGGKVTPFDNHGFELDIVEDKIILNPKIGVADVIKIWNDEKRVWIYYTFSELPQEIKNRIK